MKKYEINEEGNEGNERSDNERRNIKKGKWGQ
jgi:hypothetical protein